MKGKNIEARVRRGTKIRILRRKAFKKKGDTKKKVLMGSNASQEKFEWVGRERGARDCPYDKFRGMTWEDSCKVRKGRNSPRPRGEAGSKSSQTQRREK